MKKLTVIGSSLHSFEAERFSFAGLVPNGSPPTQRWAVAGNSMDKKVGAKMEIRKRIFRGTIGVDTCGPRNVNFSQAHMRRDIHTVFECVYELWGLAGLAHLGDRQVWIDLFVGSFEYFLQFN